MTAPGSPIRTLDYGNKHILAPMVRMGTLPMRLLCLDYGCDIVYSEEIVDLKLLQCDRVENLLYGTVDYQDKTSGEIVFRTHPDETNHVVLQIGTASADMAAEVAAMVENDVAGLDINMGCPKDYSVKGGMGAALLTKPDLVEDILRTVRRKFHKSLSCKIRLLPKLDDTISLVKRIASTGVNAIAVHGRTKEERPRHRNNVEVIRLIAETVDIPIIANGSSAVVHSRSDMEQFRLIAGAASTMTARSAQRNPSIFRAAGKLPREQVITEYLRKAIDYDRNFRNAKYAVQHFYGDTSVEEGQRLLGTLTFRELCQVFHLENYDDEQRIRRGLQPEGQVPKEETTAPDAPTGGTKRIHDITSASELVDIFCESLDYEPVAKRLKRANNTKTPKSLLLEYCVRMGIPSACFNFTGNGRSFLGTVAIEGKTFASTVPHRTKKDAEQACAIVALKHFIPGFDI